MANRGYKLQEFLAHSANVNCLSIGKKTSRLLITGGDDYKVNLWSIGKPTSLMSLCGHTSAVDSVAFDSAEVLVLAGASSGVIKLWDLEESKMVRAFTGHRSNCSAVEFHPFGDFLASGSSDTNLKIWDIRKKGCVQSYKGHTRGINTIKFTPDGRWVVSGGLDNVVKVWDLTAGKLLHEFKFHEGPIRSLDFHPLEFLLATGSADRTVKFWDLETFELIGSTRPEATGVRSTTFHPDGRTLFCGLDEGLKVYSWEPVVCHDGVDMGWSTLGDTCISEGKLLGCSYFQSSVGIWVSDISKIEPYGTGSVDKKECMEKILGVLDDQSSNKKMGSSRRSSSQDYETKEIKNIYIDSTGGNRPLSTRKVNSTSTGQAGDKSFIGHSIVTRDNDIEKESSDSGKESITFSKTKPGMLLRPAHVRKTPTKFNETKQSLIAQLAILKQSESDGEKDLDTKNAFDSEQSDGKQFDVDDSIIKSITNKFEKALLPEPPSDEAKGMMLKPHRTQRRPSTKSNEAQWTKSVDSGTLDSQISGLEYSRDVGLPTGLVDDRGSNPCEEDINHKSISIKSERVPSPEKAGDELKCKESNPVKIVRGVKVVSGRTRSLVERFERGEKVTHSEDKAADATVVQNTNAVQEEPQTTSRQVVSTTPTQVTQVKLDEATIVQNTNAMQEEPQTTSRQVVSTTPTQVTQVKLDEATIVQNTDAVQEEPQTTSRQVVSTTPTQVMQVKLDEATNSATVEAPGVSTRRSRSTSTRVMPVVLSRDTNMTTNEPPVTSARPERGSVKSVIANQATNLTSDKSPARSARQARISSGPVMPVILNQTTNLISDEPPVVSTRRPRASSSPVMPVILGQVTNAYDERPVALTRSARRNSPSHVISVKLNQSDSMSSDERALSRSARSSPARVIPMKLNQANNVTSDASHITSRQRISPTQRLPTPVALDQVTDMVLEEANITPSPPDCDISTQKEEAQVSGRENAGDIIETVMKTHDEFLNTLQSRLLKLQIIRHFWERSDIKGAIAALRKLSDHSVQADVISILTDKTEILTLDLFSQLVPVLAGLLGSRTERPVNVSLEMLLKLVAVFGTVIRSTVSAPKCVGVDLHAEERLQICQSCSTELQKVQRMLPLLTRRGGLITRKAQELNLVLQAP